MRRKIFSIFGITAVLSFFLPWLKTCDKVETGFELLILGSLKDLAASSISSLNTGVVFLLVPVYAVLAAWIARPEAPGRGLKIFFGFIAALSLWNVGVWGGLETSALLNEWGTERHLHAISMAKFLGIALIAAAALTIFILKWARTGRFDVPWSCAVLILPVFPALGLGFTIEPRYYGMWIYLISMVSLLAGSIWEAVWPSRNGKGV